MSLVSRGWLWRVLTQLSFRPAEHIWSHGGCLAKPAFIMAINFWTKNEWWNNTIQRDVKLPFTKGPYIDSRQFHISFARSGLIEYETTGRREFQCGSFTFHPRRERRDIFHVFAILLMYRTWPWVDPLLEIICS